MENDNKSVVYHALKSVSFWLLSIAFTVGYLYVGSYLNILEDRNMYGKWKHETTDGLCLESTRFGRDQFWFDPPYLIVWVKSSGAFDKEYTFEICSYDQYTLDKPKVYDIKSRNDMKDRDREWFLEAKAVYNKTKTYVIIVFIVMLMFIGPRLDQYIKGRISKD